MRTYCGVTTEPLSRLERAGQVLRAQLEALVGLAAIAIRLFEGITPPRVTFEPGRPLIGVAALERAVRDHARVSWALRLIWALRAKLMGDLARVERGEGVNEVLAAEARPPVAARTEADGEKEFDFEAELAALRREMSGSESEGLERESFGPYLSRRSSEAEFAEILKRPTHEVIALIREALRVAAPWSDGAAGFERDTAWPGLVPHAAAPPPGPSDPGLRSPC